MCGIAGIVDLRRLRPVPSHALLRMARSQRHRGPDEEGFFLEEGIGLACRKYVLAKRGVISSATLRKPAPALSKLDIADVERLLARQEKRLKEIAA